MKLHWGVVDADGKGMYCRNDKNDIPEPVRQPDSDDYIDKKTMEDFSPPYRRACFMEVPDDGKKRVAITRTQIRTFQEYILHGDEAHRQWLIASFDEWIGQLFGEAKAHE